MKFLILLLLLCSVFSPPLTAYALDKAQIVVTPDDIEIKDKTLETSLIKAVKENGTLTSTRQVHSYMIAVLCEYPEKPKITKPYCTFRKVKVLPGE
jgi:hypothetical protein